MGRSSTGYRLHESPPKLLIGDAIQKAQVRFEMDRSGIMMAKKATVS
jgi:hypothetical protein